MNFFRVIFPNCRQVSQLQSEALDHALLPGQRAGMRLHLLICGWCRRYGKQIRFLHRAAHDHPEEWQEAGAPGLPPEARERIKRTLKNNS